VICDVGARALHAHLLVGFMAYGKGIFGTMNIRVGINLEFYVLSQYNGNCSGRQLDGR